MSMYLVDDMSEVAKIMQNGSRVLLPTSSGWCLGTTLDRMDLLPPVTNTPILDERSILVNSIAMFKSLIPNLHPRIETLLLQHNQPLGLVFEAEECAGPKEDHSGGPVVIRLATHDYTKNLIESLGMPICVQNAYFHNKVVFRLEDLPSEWRSMASFVSAYHHRESEYTLPVLARYNKKAILEFIRE